jgi:Transglycosylase SLT domain
MEKSFDSPRSSKLLLGVPLGMLAILVVGLLGVAVIAGASPQCGVGSEAVGDLNGKAPRRLVPIYQAAAARYRLGERGPAILAAINEVETDFGTNMGPSSAGAIGWMQFMPESWETYGVDADGDGRKDPSDPWDAIFAAARLLQAAGAPEDWHGAIFSYNHAEWYVEEVEAAAERLGGTGSEVLSVAESTGCASAAPSGVIVNEVVRLFAPRAFKPLPARLWVDGGSPESVDARIWPDAVWLLETYDLRVTAARESGHETHGDGTAMDMVPASGRGWGETALRAALDLGWIPSCGASGSAPVCPLVAAIQFIGYNGYPGHGDPSHAGENAHLHVSWKSSDYGCPGLCEPREWVEVFPWQE